MSSDNELKEIIVRGIHTHYFIDRYGNVQNSDGHRLAYYISNSGYYRVTIFIKKIRYKFSVHRLMAEAYIGHIGNGMVVNHIDGNKLNNCVENLEIVTLEENMHHASVHDLVSYGEDHYRAKFKEETIRKICKLLENGAHTNYICKTLHVPVSLVTAIRSKDSWCRISDEYDFEPLVANINYGDKLEIALMSMILWGYSNEKIYSIFGAKTSREKMHYYQKIRRIKRKCSTTIPKRFSAVEIEQ